MKQIHWGILLITLILAGGTCTAVDWPEWRGPDRTGRSSETGLLRSWPDDGPPQRWRIDSVGEGFSTPSIAEDRIFVMGNSDGAERVYCLDATNRGETLWTFRVGDVRHGGGGYEGPRCTPTVDGERVYALGLNGDLVCLATDDGTLHWKLDLVAEFDGRIPNWGYSESPLVDGERLLVTPGGARATIVAVDKSDGTTQWMSSLGSGAAYASMIRATFDGVDQYVQFLSERVVGVRAADGAELWSYDAPANGTANCSTPLADANGVFAASGYGTGGGLVRITGRGSAQDATEVYYTRKMKNHHGGMIRIGDYLYGSNDPGVLTCLDWETGDVAWSDRSCGKCSLVCVDGMLISRSEDGLVSLVEASPQGFDLVGRFDETDTSGSPTWPHPVVCDGQLYLRDQAAMVCYDVADRVGD